LGEDLLAAGRDIHDLYKSGLRHRIPPPASPPSALAGRGPTTPPTLGAARHTLLHHRSMGLLHLAVYPSSDDSREPCFST
jgi:hypothetical protein